MHPPLAPHRHQMCETQIAALTRCHEENSVAKFWGVCNQVREMLDKCLQQEHHVVQGANAEKGRKRKEELAKMQEAIRVD